MKLNLVLCLIAMAAYSVLSGSAKSLPVDENAAVEEIKKEENGGGIALEANVKVTQYKKSEKGKDDDDDDDDDDVDDEDDDKSNSSSNSSSSSSSDDDDDEKEESQHEFDATAIDDDETEETDTLEVHHKAYKHKESGADKLASKIIKALKKGLCVTNVNGTTNIIIAIAGHGGSVHLDMKNATSETTSSEGDSAVSVAIVKENKGGKCKHMKDGEHGRSCKCKKCSRKYEASESVEANTLVAEEADVVEADVVVEEENAKDIEVKHKVKMEKAEKEVKEVKVEEKVKPETTVKSGVVTKVKLEKAEPVEIKKEKVEKKTKEVVVVEKKPKEEVKEEIIEKTKVEEPEPESKQGPKPVVIKEEEEEEEEEDKKEEAKKVAVVATTAKLTKKVVVTTTKAPIVIEETTIQKVREEKSDEAKNKL